MKGDFTRFTFKKEKHYSSVRMQQGRVQVDADWNEQADITLRRIETEAADLIGGCGGPLHYPGFHLVADVNALNPEEQTLEGNQNPPTLGPGDLHVSAGRYYVEGVVAENERIVALSRQPYLPGLEVTGGVLGFGSLLKKAIGKGEIHFDLPEADNARVFQAYLDVWQRHLTALEDPSIREKALGGPDTATRTQTVWQVKLLKADNADGTTTCLSPLNLPKSTGQLKAQTKQVATPPDPCVVPESAGYRGLENQLYRVEIHQGGDANTATFKWSRENGSVVTRWIGQDSSNSARLIVESPGRDAVLGFSAGDWVELTDELRELWGLPGTLVQVESVEGQTITVKAGSATGTLSFADFQGNPKIRRWDHNKGSAPEPKNAVLTVEEGKWIDLEQGIQVWFEAGGTYRTGDYWLIPARTANADAQSGQIEWPQDESNNPLLQPPHGIQHHYCPLAVLTWDGAAFTSITDCRRLFPPVTELTSLLYVSGDGQEAMPGQSLPQPLRVRVANGQHPVIGAKVQFTLKSGGGSLSVTSPVATTTPDGVAECVWTLGRSGPQQVEAHLLDAAGNPVPGQVVGFNAAFRPGCCVTVGPEGDFPDLNTALNNLLGRGERQISLCLQAGDHKLDGFRLDLSLDKRPLHLEIRGCGPATGLRLTGPLELIGVDTVSLHNLAISVTFIPQTGTAALTFRQCAYVSITDTSIAGITASASGITDTSIAGATSIAGVTASASDGGSALLAIIDSDTARLSGNTFMAAIPERTFTLLRRLFADAQLTQLADLFTNERNTIAPEWWESVRKAAEELASHADQRHRIVSELERLMAQMQELSTGEVLQLRKLALALRTEAVGANTLVNILVNILFDLRAAAVKAWPGTAIMLHQRRSLPFQDSTTSAAGATADVFDEDNMILLEHNRIAGIISLYGMPPPVETIMQKREGLKGLKVGNDAPSKLSIPSGLQGTIHLRSNHFVAIRIASALLDELLKLAASYNENPFLIEDVCARLLLDGNIIEGIANLTLSQRLILQANTFTAMAVPITANTFTAMPVPITLGWCVANGATYVGNHGPDPRAILYDIAKLSENVANLQIQIS